jgi:pentatricopeptide repeat protein
MVANRVMSGKIKHVSDQHPYRKSKYSPEKKQMRFRTIPYGLKSLFNHIRDGNTQKAMAELDKIIEIPIIRNDSVISHDNIDIEFQTPKYLIQKNNYDDILRELGDQGLLNDCDVVLQKMKERNVKPNVITYNILISRAASWQNIEKVESYFGEMKKNSIRPDVRIYNCLINAYVKSGNIDKGYEILKQMKSYCIEPTVVTFNTLIDGCVRIKSRKVDSVKLALQIFSAMKLYNIEPNYRSYSSLIHVYCDCGDIHKGYETLQYIRNELNITPSYVTYSVLLHAYGKAGDLNKAFDILSDMKRAGHYPNIITLSSLINACSKHGKLDKAYDIYTDMLQSRFIQDRPNSITCSCLIDSYLKTGNVDKALIILNDMEKYQIPLTQVTYTSLLCELTKLKRFDIISNISSYKRTENLSKRASRTPFTRNYLNQTLSINSSVHSNLESVIMNTSYISPFQKDSCTNCDDTNRVQIVDVSVQTSLIESTSPSDLSMIQKL